MPDTTISLDELPELRANRRTVDSNVRTYRGGATPSYTRHELLLALAHTQLEVEHVRAGITRRLDHIRLERKMPKISEARIRGWIAWQMEFVRRDHAQLRILLNERRAWNASLERLDDKERAGLEWAKPVLIGNAGTRALSDFFTSGRAFGLAGAGE